MAGHDERRSALRVDANLNLEVKVARADGSVDTASLETINISTSGVYFKSDHFVEPMTKLAMELELSVPGPNPGDSVEVALVPCEGLVVRTTPEGEVEGCTDYEVAVFFTHIEAEGLNILESHIKMRLGHLD